MTDTQKLIEDEQEALAQAIRDSLGVTPETIAAGHQRPGNTDDLARDLIARGFGFRRSGEPSAEDHDIVPRREPQGEPSDAPRSVPRLGVLHLKGESGTLCGVQNPSHVTDGPRYADCAECLVALSVAGGVR